MVIYEKILASLQNVVIDDLDRLYEEMTVEGIQVSQVVSRDLFYFMAESPKSWSLKGVLWHFDDFGDSVFNDENRSLLDCMKNYIGYQLSDYQKPEDYLKYHVD